MTREFFLNTKIIACPTERDPDGLAMSSRNTRLSPQAREKAAKFPQLLKHPDAKAKLKEAGFEVDYIENWKGRTLGAVRLENVRLIDNL